MLTVRRLLWFGIVLRVLVFGALTPNGNDDHYQVVAYIVAHHRLPASDMFSQSYHPPLFYLLATPFVALGHEKGGQLLSLILSVANLWLIARLLGRSTLLRTDAARTIAMLVAAILPQFVIFGLIVSNDTLAFLVGTLTFVAAFAFIERPSPRTIAALGIVVGVGLLTKGTFLAMIPVAVLLIIAVARREKVPVRRATAALAYFGLIAASLGCYKFVENEILLGRPIVHNLDFDSEWKREQSGTIRGVSSFVDLNVPALVRDPFARSETRHSIPMLLYATTWYALIRESNFVVTRDDRRLRIVTSAMAALAIVPTLLVLVGLVSILRDRELEGLTSVALVLAVLGIVCAAGVRYDVWSCFQGRLLFPSMVGIVTLIARGVDTLHGYPRKAALAGIVALFGVYMIYYAIEIPAVATRHVGAVRRLLRQSAAIDGRGTSVTAYETTSGRRAPAGGNRL